MTDEHAEPVLLDAAADSEPELFDHPDDLTPEEVEAGHALWESIDDLDDHSNGVDDPERRTASPGYAEALRRARIVRDCLLAAGVPEVSIELMDGRPGSGDTWNLCRPVSPFSHHIASTPTPSNPTPGLSLVKRGRPGLSGPLANGTAGVDLVYRILTMGMANHPGTGGPLTVSGPMGTYVIPRDVARPYAWGTEFEGGYSDAVWDRVYTNKRTGKSMTFREFMGRVNAGLVRAVWLINGRGKNPGRPGQYDLSGYHGEHKTWAPGRKPDRLNYTTSTGRAEIRKYDNLVPAGDEGDDDVSAKDIWDYQIMPLTKGATQKVKASLMLARAHSHAVAAHDLSAAAAKNAEAALRQAKANREAIRALADTLDKPTAQKITAALGPDLDDDIVRPEALDFDPETVDGE